MDAQLAGNSRRSTATSKQKFLASQQQSEVGKILKSSLMSSNERVFHSTPNLAALLNNSSRQSLSEAADNSDASLDSINAATQPAEISQNARQTQIQGLELPGPQATQTRPLLTIGIKSNSDQPGSALNKLSKQGTFGLALNTNVSYANKDDKVLGSAVDEEVDDVVGELKTAAIAQPLPQFCKHIVPVEAAQLCDMLLEDIQDAEPKLLILDFRSFAAFNSQRIVNSHNVHLPSLLLKRFRRGSVQCLNGPVLICSDQGKKLWHHLVHEQQEKFRVIIVDQDLPVMMDGWRNLSSSSISAVTSIIDKDLSTEADNRHQLYWLTGGYASFYEHCLQTSQSINLIQLPNMRWIYFGVGEEAVSAQDVALPAASLNINTLQMPRSNEKLSALPSSLKICTPRRLNTQCLELSDSINSPLRSALSSKASNKTLKSYLQSSFAHHRRSVAQLISAEKYSPKALRDAAHGLPTGALVENDDEDFDFSLRSSKSSPTVKQLDFSVILDWLLLGADPAVMKDSHSSPSSPAANSSVITIDSKSTKRLSDVWIEVPSPTKLYVSTPAVGPASAISKQDLNASVTQSNRNSSTATIKSKSESPSSDSDSEKRVFDFNVPFGQSTDGSLAGTTRMHGHHVDIDATRKQFESMQVKFVINMALECPDVGPYLVKSADIQSHLDQDYQLTDYKKFGLWDNIEADNIEHHIRLAIEQLLLFHEREPNAKIYVHCKAGKSRSATIIMAFLMKFNNWTVDQAYEFVKLRRPCACPNIGFMTVLRKLQNENNN